MAKQKTIVQRNQELAKTNQKLRLFGCKLRAYFTPAQIQKANQSIGCARFTSNFYLKERIEVYNTTGLTLRPDEFKKSFIMLKSHAAFSWLAEADKYAIECAIEHVDAAYDRFFKGLGGFPKVKKKHASEQNYSTKFVATKQKNGNITHNIAIHLDENKIKLPKLGWLKVAFSKQQMETFKAKDDSFKIKGATITRHSNGQWFVTLKLEEIVDLVEKPDVSLVSDDKIVGIDVGLTHFAILSDGTKIENPKYYQKSLNTLKSHQKRLSRMKKGSQNYIKQKMKLAKLHRHIKNMRHDFLHKISRKLVNENQVIVLEDLNVKGMIKNKKLAKSIQDVGWSTFKAFLTYKSEWDNKHVVFVDRFFPSSKLCGGCHEKNVWLSLSEREWVCPNCGMHHDRDINAAENIKQEGLRILTSNLVAI